MSKVCLRGVIQLLSDMPETRQSLEKLQLILSKTRDENKQVEIAIDGLKWVVNPVHVLGPGKPEYRNQPDGQCKITFYVEQDAVK